MRLTAAVGTALITLALFVGCAPARSPGAAAAAPVVRSQSAAPPTPVDPLIRAEAATTKISVISDSVTRPFRNGQKVAVGNGTVAEIWFNPYPPLGATTLTVKLLDAASLTPVDTSLVSLRYDMPEHGHGIIAQRLTQVATGSHEIRLTLNMVGTYKVELDMRTSDSTGRLTLEFTSPAP